MSPRLFIPGPVEVDEPILDACAQPMIGHRSAEFSQLFRTLRHDLAWCLGTAHPIYLSTSSATGIWELAARNGVKRRALTPVMGAFSKRWHETINDCGKVSDAIALEWGQAVSAEAIDEALTGGEYDAVCLVHSETSTGVLNPLADIARVVSRHPDVLLFVDAVSSLTTLPIDVDALGIDLIFASVQKGFGLPPGLTVFAASPRLHERARGLTGRGTYFDLLSFEKYAAKDQTPTTPCLPQLFALKRQLGRMREETLAARYARHQQLAERCRAWAAERFELFPPADRCAPGLTCVRNSRAIDVGALNRHLRDVHDVQISDGYGKLKGTTFRIAHMADRQPDELEQLLGWIDAYLDRP